MTWGRAMLPVRKDLKKASHLVVVAYTGNPRQKQDSSQF